jgi:adenylosuccinate synthase
MINGITQVVMTKADVLDSFANLNVCTAYSINGKITDEVPFAISKVEINPQYKAFKGWNCDSTVLKQAAEVPVDMSQYIEFINEFIGAPIKYVSNRWEENK